MPLMLGWLLTCSWDFENALDATLSTFPGTLQHLDDDEMLTYVCSLSGPLFSGITLGGSYTLWLFNMAMGNGPFTDGLPIKNGDFPWLC